MNALIKILGLSAPLAAALVIYGLFRFLDRKASSAANRAIVAWMKGEKYRRLDLETVVINSFDHLYGKPLFGLNAFVRCAGISALAIVIYILFRIGFPDPNFITIFYFGFVISILALAPAIIVTDYLSLFLVRKCLDVAKRNLALSVILALVIGILAIGVAFIMTWTLFNFAIRLSTAPHLPIRLVETAALAALRALQYFPQTLRDLYSSPLGAIKIVLPTIFVHLWIPLLLLGATINRSLNVFFRTVGFAQWFIKRGHSHPLEAIGMTASGVVLMSATLWQVIVYFLAG